MMNDKQEVFCLEDGTAEQAIVSVEQARIEEEMARITAELSMNEQFSGKRGYYWVEFLMVKSVTGWKYVADNACKIEAEDQGIGELVREVCLFEPDEHNPECAGWYRTASDEHYSIDAYNEAIKPLHPEPLTVPVQVIRLTPEQEAKFVEALKGRNDRALLLLEE